VHLENTQARLRSISPELDSIFSTSSTPRKLDVLKLRISVKNIFKQLKVAHSVILKEYAPYHITNRSMVESGDLQLAGGESIIYLKRKLC
jgi:hypothetical protein